MQQVLYAIQICLQSGVMCINNVFPPAAQENIRQAGNDLTQCVKIAFVRFCVQVNAVVMIWAVNCAKKALKLADVFMNHNRKGEFEIIVC